MIVIPRVAPGGAFLGAVGQIWGIMQAEITMQWRRWGLWLAFAGATALLLLLTVQAATFLLHLPQPRCMFANILHPWIWTTFWSLIQLFMA